MPVPLFWLRLRGAVCFVVKPFAGGGVEDFLPTKERKELMEKGFTRLQPSSSLCALCGSNPTGSFFNIVANRRRAGKIAP
jgi:hypothetical protein